VLDGFARRSYPDGEVARRWRVGSVGMSRYVVIREGQDGAERLVGESAVPTEAALHEVLMRPRLSCQRLILDLGAW
jgi:hypothetical protein